MARSNVEIKAVYSQNGWQLR